MRRLMLSAAAVSFFAAVPVWAADVPLKHVTLSTAGLAQFEHRGTVTGNQMLTLPVRLDQVDDILKSLVVFDAGGSFGGVSLPGRESLDAIFRDLPFSRDALNNPESLLAALQGADVVVSSAAEVMRGKLVSVSPEQSITRDQQVVRRHRVAVMTNEGLKLAILEDLRSMQFSDKAVQDQVTRALTALHANRVQDQRVVTLDIRGEGSRNFAFSYVTEAPIWKTAYRLVLTEEDKNSAYIQGWAILENTTGHDWKDVTVTLLSGNPVTYRQALYDSYYLSRPFLPLRVMDRLMPRTDEGAVAVLDSTMSGSAAPARALKSGQARAAAGRYDAASSDMGAAMPMMMQAEMAVAAAPEMAHVQGAVAENSLGSGMAFTLPVAVNIPGGSSMMMPIIARDIPAEQLWLYQPDTHPRHPLAAVSLYNNTETNMPPGILTLFDGKESGLLYAGDAELAMLPKGDTRYVTFALDPTTIIDRTQQSERVYGTFSASKGVLKQHVVATDTTSYIIKAPEGEDRTVVIEHPRRAGWDLKNPNGEDAENKLDIEQTETHYRIKVNVDRNETRRLSLTLNKTEFEQLTLWTMSPDSLLTRIAAVGNDLPENIRSALEAVVPLQRDVAAQMQAIKNLEQRRDAIFSDQTRLRGNLESIPSGSDLAKRYLSELNTQEDQLKKITQDMSATQKRLEDARAKLDSYVGGLSF
jgi:hypothetical protein